MSPLANRTLADELLCRIAGFGLDPRRTLRAAGLDHVARRYVPGTLPPLSRIELAVLYRESMLDIATLAARHVAQPGIGPVETQLLGHALISAPDLHEVIRRAGAFYAMLARIGGSKGPGLWLEVADRRASLCFGPSAAPAHPSVRLNVLHGAALHLRLFNWLIGEDIVIDSAAINTELPLSRIAVAELFPAAPAFAPAIDPAWELRLDFDAEHLQRPVVRSDSDMRHLLELGWTNLLVANAPGISVTDSVGLMLNAALTRGTPLPTTRQLAAFCNRSEPTLRRHLAAEGTTVRAIRERCQRDKALELLGQSRLPLSEIANRIGFSDVPTFHRAFRRWVGSAPAAYRREAGANSRVESCIETFVPADSARCA